MPLRLLVTLLSTLLLGVMTMAPARAIQPTNDNPFLITEIFGINWQWSADGSQFVFMDDGLYRVAVDVPEAKWYSYDFETETLRSSTSWPLYPRDFPGTFLPVQNSNNIRSFAFGSPSSRFVVYATTQNRSFWQIAIGDLNQGSTQHVNANIYDPFLGSPYFDVIWNSQESSFIISSSNDYSEPYFVHVTGINQPDSQIKSWFYISIPYGTETYPVVKVLDITADGTGVLALTRQRLPPSSPQTFGAQYLVSASLDADGQLNIDWLIEGNDIVAAAFLPTDESKLLILNLQGLVELDQNNDNITVLEPRSTFGVRVGAWFSPDAEWLAFQNEIGLYAYRLP
ncbi:MAG: hypothetical protein J0M33_15660 [Anaerolineae bacterium]|nr:hypothetical protein [Anaerolineae bacterium]